MPKLGLQRFLTQLLQGRNTVLVPMVLGDRGDAASHQTVGQRLYWQLGGVQAADQGLETLVGKGRLAAIQLDDSVEGGAQGRLHFLSSIHLMHHSTN